ncbi:MAG TPA: hypothetical protein VIO38_01800 [Rariglobus sp.]
MTTLSRILFFVCLGCLSSGAALSQPPAAEERGVEISLVGLGALPERVKIADGKRGRDVSVPASGRGQPFRHTGAPHLVFVREETDAEGNVRLVPVAEVTFSPAWKKVLVVLMSAGQGRFNAQAFDDSAEGFPPGFARVFNFYKSTLAVNNGAGLAEIAPGASELMQLHGARTRMWMKVAVRRPQEWELLPTFVTQVAPNTRLLLFAYEAPGDEGVMEQRYRSITEVVVTGPLAVR